MEDGGFVEQVSRPYLLSIIRQVEGTFVAALLITSFHYSAAGLDNTLYLRES